jgi:hypothetical protein
MITGKYSVREPWALGSRNCKYTGCKWSWNRLYSEMRCGHMAVSTGVNVGGELTGGKGAGIDIWPGKEMHSHNYRDPQSFTDKVPSFITLPKLFLSCDEG